MCAFLHLVKCLTAPETRGILPYLDRKTNSLERIKLTCFKARRKSSAMNGSLRVAGLLGCLDIAAYSAFITFSIMVSL